MLPNYLHIRKASLNAAARTQRAAGTETIHLLLNEHFSTGDIAPIILLVKWIPLAFHILHLDYLHIVFVRY